MIKLNEEMLKLQEAEENREAILEKYEEIKALLHKAKLALPPTEEDRKYFTSQITKLEFELQELWNFPQDVSYHKYWIYLPGCLCPELDNYDLLGVNLREINTGCPWHGKGE